MLADDKLSERITKEIGGDQDKLGKGGYFSTGDIPLGKDVVSYKVQVFAENKKRVGVNNQSPRLQYNLPILADFSVIQDTVEPSKEVARRIITKLKEKGKITEDQEKKIKEKIDKAKKTSELKSAMSGNVKVRYVDKATGNVITNIKNDKAFGEKDSENRYTAAKDVLINSDYNVTDRAYSTLSTTDDKYYRLVADNGGLATDSEPATGTIGTTDKVVTFLYEVAEKPATPTTGKGVVHFKKQVSETVTEPLTGYGDITLEGNVGDTFSSTDVDTRITALKNAGYEIIGDTFTNGNKTIDTIEDAEGQTPSQEYTITVKEKVVDVPTPPTPDTPVDPNIPDGPKWPAEGLKESDLKKEVTRTITYVKKETADGKEEPSGKDPVTQTAHFTRKASYNVVTGTITYGKWESADKELAKVDTPELTGYVADKASVDKVETNADSTGLDQKVVYTKLGSWVPRLPEGVTPPTGTDMTPKPYPNNPTDPTKPGDPTDPNTPNVPVIPYVPGYTPKTPDGNPLVPVDPEHPENGYKVPPVPETPGTNTDITYVADPQKAIVKYIVEGTTTVLHKDELTGDSGTTINYTTANKLAELKALGYELVTDGFTTETGRNFDKDKTVDQTFEVTVKPKVVDVPPFEPTNPKGDDNPKPEPGKPIDPENPNGPKWTKELIDKLETTKHVTRTITYVEDGTDKEVANKATDKVTFTRSLKVNVVTGDVVDPNVAWTSNDTTFDEVASPVVKGYVLKANQGSEDGLVSTDGSRVVASTNLTATSANQNLKVVYTKLGSWVPKVPGVETPTPLPYPNHPTDPTKPKDPEYPQPGTPTDPNTPKPPVIPYVPGYTPKTPNGNPLEPVDPNHPENGYKVPPVPTTPGKDTPIEYSKDSQKAIVKYVVEGTNTVLHTEELTGDSETKINYTTANKLAELKVLGYELVTDGFTTETGRNFDKDKTVDQTFEVIVKPKVVDVPPFEPTDPKDPNKPEPGQPIDPENPNGPKWTKALIDKLEMTKHVTRTITYVEDGTDTEVANKATDKVTFTRSLKVNVVTGDVVDPNVAWTSNDTTFEAVTSPVVKGYVLKANQGSEDGLVSTDGTRVVASANLTEASENQNVKVLYTKLGSWVPTPPAGVTPPTGTNFDPKPYPNNPTDPTKPKDPEYPQPGTPTDPNTPKPPVIPYVPGYTPKTPNGNPLEPVDPNHPENGYKVPPVPTTPGKDTPIEYSKDSQKAIVKVFNTTTGTEVELPKEKVELSGKTGEEIPTNSVAAKIADLEKRGYTVENKEPLKGETFDKNKDPENGDPTQVFKLLVKERTVTVTEPKNPNEPVDPDKPEGPKWPTEGLAKSDLEKEVTRTITYVKKETADGPEIADAKPTKKQTAHFKRSATYNLVTKVVTPGEWTSTDKVLEAVTTEKLDGYVADKASVEEVETNVNSTDLDKKVVYTKLGSWIPKVPGEETPTPLPYPNNPDDPTKPGTPVYPEPGTPTDPNTPKPPVIPYVPGYTPKTPDGNPLVPVDPEHPENGYKVPPVPTIPGNDTPITYEKVPDKPKPETTGTKEVTRTIKYVDEKGNELAKPSTDKVTFTRNGSDWNAVDGDSTFDAVKSPVVKGYILKDSAQKVVEKETVKSDAKDETITVVYTKVGSYVPKVPEGVTPPSPTPYDNDPQDPSKVVTPNPEKPQDPNDPNSPKVPVIPQVPGHTPVVPKDPTKPVSPENPLVPLEPVDPNHPENGYKVPPVPTEPGRDTPIEYEKDGQQKAITSFVDPKGNVLETPITETGDSNAPLTKDGEIKATIAKLKLKGYDVETNTYPPKGTFDNDPKVDQYFKVTLTPRVKPVKPFDPTNPKDPNRPVPGQPIDPDTPVDPNNPNDPTIPRWTEDLINKLETTKQVTRTINYVDETGNKVSEPSADKVTFTREAKINVVTGEITYGDWKAVGGDSTFDKVSSPVVKGYILKDPAQKEVAERKGITPTVANQTIEVVYKKLGSWIPKVPGVETPTPLPYPNHPTDPTKPGDPTDPNTPNVPVIPYVPGYTPKIGETPLQPKVPNDPTKGYIPPVPTEPGKDTPIEYVKVPNTPSPEEPVKPTPESNHITIWVDENGKPLKPEQPGTHEAGNIPGYRFITTTTKDGVTIHKFEKITPVEPNNPVPEKPTTPIPTPQDPTTPTPESQIPTPNTPEANTPTSETSRREELPNTGTEANASLASAGIMTLLAGLGLGFFKKKEEDDK